MTSDDPGAVPVVSNRAGLSAVQYRSGTWSHFRAAMLDAVSTVPELGGLRTRDSDDFTIALLDSWAVVCDILTFYQERIANEAYLRTATETLSVGELAKLIGYKLRPGLAASAALAFTIDAPLPTPPAPNSPPTGAPSSVVLPSGIRGQTIPDPGTQPAIFETTAPISARAEWNAIAARTRYPESGWTPVYADVWLDGISTGVRAGDHVLMSWGNIANAQQLNVVAAHPDTATGTTRLVLPNGIPPIPEFDPVAQGSVGAGANLDDAFVWASVRGHVWNDQSQLLDATRALGWATDEVEERINALRTTTTPGTARRSAYLLGHKVGVFGNNAPDYNGLSADQKKIYTSNWNTYSLDTASPGGYLLDLESVVPVKVGDLVVVVDQGEYLQHITTVTSVAELTRTDYMLSSKITRIGLASWPTGVWWWIYTMRGTRVYLPTAILPVVDMIAADDVQAGSITLDGAYQSLTVGQLVSVTGVLAGTADQTASEVVTVSALALVDGRTRITVSPSLANRYRRGTVRVNANVAPATHGETTSEILGSGNATVAFQRFALKQPPLTYVSAATASASASTLTVRVDGVAWTEVQWLSSVGPTDRVFTVVAGVDGKTYVQFGDGVTGARPATGANNIVATYRHGTGRAGLTRAGQVSTLMDRPLGLTAVTNPLPSVGAADPETLAAARGNAPMTVRTLDRIVSLPDVADFAASSAGIAKASVHWVWDGARFVACATVAGIDGAAIPAGTDQHANLLQAMRNAADGTLPVVLCSYRLVTVTVAATISPDPARIATDVLAAVKAALHAAFGFGSRAFGQAVFASEVVEVMQQVPGVVALTLDGMARGGSPTAPAPVSLSAAPPDLGVSELVGAELLTLDTGPLPWVVLA